MEDDLQARVLCAMDVLEAREDLRLQSVIAWPHLKPRPRADAQRTLHQRAFPKELQKPSAPVTIKELAAMFGVGEIKPKNG
jgi:hypothetical protein